MTITNETRIEALKEASISIACCLDEVSEVTKEDLEHIQSQLCILENYEDEEEVRNRKLTRELKADIRYMRNEDWKLHWRASETLAKPSLIAGYVGQLGTNNST